jgi:integrase
VRLLLTEADAGESLSGLSSVLRRYRERARARQFNLVRSAVQAFVRDRFGRRSALYAEVSDVPPRPYRPQPGRPLSPQALAAFGLPEPLAGMVWTMALTGMGPAEYWGSWMLRLDRVEVHGTKRPGRERVVPRVGNPEVPSWAYWHTQRVFRERTGHGLYDLRRSYAGWLEEAGVPITRVRAYLGHGPSSVTDRYLWREVESHLREDASRLAAYVSSHGASERVAVSL